MLYMKWTNDLQGSVPKVALQFLSTFLRFFYRFMQILYG
jgi:hypothetical protein